MSRETMFHDRSLAAGREPRRSRVLRRAGRFAAIAVWAAVLLHAATDSSAVRAADDESPRRLYVPADQLDALISRDRTGVMLPREEFEKLVADAAAAGAERLPEAAVLASTTYTGRIEGDRLVLRVEARARAFGAGWSTIPLRIGGLGIESAQVGDEAAAVSRGERPEILEWLLQDAGESTLVIEASRPLEAVGSDRVAAFDLAGAPAGELRLTLPAGKHLQVGGASLNRPAEADAPAEYVLPIGGEQSIELRITDRASESQADALTFASTAHGLQVAPGEVTWTAHTSLQVIGRKIDRLVASVPRGLEITSVESAGLESWELADLAETPDRTTITLTWRQSFDGVRTITLRGVLSGVDSAEWSAPNLILNEVTAHTGIVEIRSPAGVRVQLRAIDGARASAAAGGAAEMLSQPAAQAGVVRYEVWREDFALTFSTSVKARELRAAMTNLVDVTDDGLMLFTLVDVSTRFDNLFELQVSLPAEWEVQELSVAGSPAVWTSAPAAAGVNELRIPLTPPLEPDESRAVRIVARRLMESWPVEQTPTRFALPEVKLPQASVVEAVYGVTGEEDLVLAPVDVSGLDPARPADLDALERQLEGKGRTLKLGFAYQDTTFAAQIEVVRKPTRLSAATLTFVELDPETITSHLETQVRVEGGGARALQVSLPEAAGADLRFHLATIEELTGGESGGLFIDAARIVEQQAAAPEGGRRLWTLRLDRRLSGDAVIWTEVRQARGEEQAYTPLVLEVVGAERQNGHIAVIAGEDQRVTLTALDSEGQPLPLVDPVDFPISFTVPVEQLRLGRKRIVASVQYLQPGYTASVSDQWFERAPAPTAVCRTARYETVVSAGGELQHEATFEIVAVGIQALTVRLSEGDRLWAALVDGAPVEVRRTQESVSIPLPAAAAPEQVRTVQLLSRGATSSLARAGSLRQTPPQLAAVTGAGSEEPLEVLEQSWVVHHSPDLLLLESEGRFYPDRAMYAGTVLGRLAETWTLPTRMEWRRMGWIALIVLSIAVLAGASLRRWGVMATVMLAMGVGLFVLIVPPATQRAREAGHVAATSESADEFLGDHSEPPPTSAMPGGGMGGGFAGDPAAAETAPNVSDARQPAQASGESTPALEGATPAPAAPAVTEPFGAIESPAGRPEVEAAGRRSGLVAQQAQSPRSEAAQESRQMFDSLQESGVQRGFAEAAAAERQLAVPANRGALLSLALALAPPDNFVSREFHYRGAEPDAAAIDLDVTYADRQGSQSIIAVIAVGVLLLMWWLRRAAVFTRGLVAVLTIGAPLALASLVPAGWLVALDGLFLGGVLGLILWMVLALATRCPCCRGQAPENAQPSSEMKPSGADVKAGLMLLAGLAGLSWCGVADADDPPADPEAGRPVVIVPYQPGADPLSAGQVLVPHDYFLKLWRDARPDEQPEALPPTAGVVTAALYRAELDPGEGAARTVKVTARLVLRRLSKDPTRVALPLGTVAIDTAELDGAPAPLSANAAGEIAIALTEPGLHILDLTFHVAATNVTDDSGRFTLPLKPVAAGRLSFITPGGNETEVRLNGASDAFRVTEQDGVRSVEAPIDAGGDVTVSWRPKLARGATEESVQAESTIGATMDDAGLTVRHRFRYVVSLGVLSEVSYTVPAGVSIKRIAGADVAGWEQANEANGRTLKVFLRRDVGDSTALDIELFQPVVLGEEAVAVEIPTLAPVGVTRERGDLALFAAPHLAAQAGDVQGLRQVNVADFTMDPALTQPDATARFAYRFDGRPFSLPVSLVRRRPETRVASEHGVQVQLRKLRFASLFRFDLRETPRASLTFALPSDYLVLEVSGDFLVDWTVQDTEDGRVLTVELDQPRTGRIQAAIEGTQPRATSGGAASISLPQPVGVNRQESQVGMWIDDAFTANIGNAPGWRPVEPDLLSESIRQLRTESPQFGFRSAETAPDVIDLELTRAQPELSGDAVVLAAASDASIDYGLTLRWRIDLAAADEFVVTTPDWLGENLEFQGEGIRQVESTLMADGSRAWRLTLHEPAKEQFLVSAVATLPLPDDDLVRAPDVRFLRPDQPIAEAVELAVQRRYLVLVNLSSVHRLDPVNADAIAGAQRDQLPLKVPDALLDQAVEIAALPVGAPPPEWTLKSTATAQAASATVLLADLRTVLAHDGSWRMQADYRVRNRGRQFLAIVPPAESRLLSVLVRDAPSQAIRQTAGGMEMLLAPLPATSAVDLSFTVRFVFAGQLARSLPEGLTPFGREIELPAPQVVSVRQSPEFGLPVLHTLWRVATPSDMRAWLVDEPGKSNLTPGEEDAAAEAYGKTLIDELKSQLRISSSELGRKSALKSQLENIGVVTRQLQELSDQQRVQIQEQEELLSKAGQKLAELRDKAGAEADSEFDASLERNDFGRNYIVGNSLEILDINGQMVNPAVEADDVLEFRLEQKFEKPVAASSLSGKDGAGEAKSRAQVRKQLQDQELSYSNAADLPQRPGSTAGGQMGGGQAAVGGLPNRFSQTWEHQSSEFYSPMNLAQQGPAAAAPGLAAAAWTTAGGLSLPMPLPTGGDELLFTKVGGEPRLTLAVQPRETVSRMLGLAWCVLCIAAALMLLRWLMQGGFNGARAAWVLVVIGAAAAVLLPAPLRYAGLAVFVLAAGWLVLVRVAAAPAAQKEV